MNISCNPCLWAECHYYQPRHKKSFIMLVLFETPAGFAIFKLLDEKKLLQSDNLFEDFKTPEGAKKVVKLKMFEKFKDTTDALASAAALIEGM